MAKADGVKFHASVLLALIVFSNTAFAEQHFFLKLAEAALERTKSSVTYDGSYRAIDYPGGDVPKNIGVCTDVVIRAYRALGIDLQKNVHEDITQQFERYPARKIWGQTKPDTNIDHRRVPNLAAFFKKNGTPLPTTLNPDDYQSGDIVTWMLPGNLPHIGIVVRKEDNRPWVVHNIGAGPKFENMLFDFPITGHYRYQPGN